ncbi:unnamed protein product, partial [marine sediment metagenome]
ALDRALAEPEPPAIVPPNVFKAAKKARAILEPLIGPDALANAFGDLDRALSEPEPPEIIPPKLPRAAEKARVILQKLLAPEGTVKLPDIEHLNFEDAVKILVGMLEDIARDIGTACGWLDDGLDDTAAPAPLEPELTNAEAAFEKYLAAVRDLLNTMHEQNEKALEVIRRPLQPAPPPAERSPYLDLTDVQRTALVAIAAKYRIVVDPDRHPQDRDFRRFFGKSIRVFLDAVPGGEDFENAFWNLP